MKILTSEKLSCRKAPESWFAGDVWLDEVLPRTPPSRMRAIRVSFEPRARTAWHTHPVGQALHVLAGVGRVQLKGQPPRTIRAGDTVWIEPGEIHWHGAAPEHTMVHLAMHETDAQGTEVAWLEQVTEEEYSERPVD